MNTVPQKTEKMNILVTGDFIKDYYIIKQPVNPTGYRDSLASTVMDHQAGGAWYLADLIKIIHKGTYSEVFIPDYQLEKESSHLKINRAFQVWSKYPELKDGKKISVWRIENFLGCEKYSDKDIINVKSKDDLLSVTKSDNEPIHMVVIDDVSLGFAEDVSLAEKLLNKTKNVKNIILKTHSSQFNSTFWKLLALKGLLTKTTVVITADSLREGGAFITRGYSWDKTIEETAKEFDSGLFSIVLGECKRVIVLFDNFGVASFTHESLQTKFKGSDIQGSKLTFERFVYDKQNYEGSWNKRFNGSIYGSLSLLTAAVTLLYTDEKFSISYIFNSALNCIQKNIELGGGSKDNIDTSEINVFIRKVFSLNRAIRETDDKDIKKEKEEIINILNKFYSAYPLYFSNYVFGLKKTESGYCSNLLKDVAGYGEHFLSSKAIDIIMRGPDKALEQVPMAKFGKYQTYDREEIERINSVHNLITVYLDHTSDSRPLSFAVFGAPGSGKSFAIKQLLESIFGESNEPLVFNLTQFRDVPDLHKALHIVRDRTVKGSIPLVFWDEFDCDNKWLKEFLAPMQDGEFSEGSISHPLGRAIFIFAGGISSTFEEYRDNVLPKKEIKGPDFISRLRGFVNIKGPDEIKGSDETSGKDEAFIIRRALLIHANLKKHHPEIFEKNKVPSISPGVVNALLKTQKYLHGARSVESIISLSRTGNNKQFDTSSLPSPELLKIHASDDFKTLVYEGELEFSLIEILAEVIHNQWKKEKEKEFWVWGKTRDDEKHTHPRLIDYQGLKEDWKEDNRITARLTKAKFASIGYHIIPPSLQIITDLEIDEIIDKHRNELIEMEHDIWLRSHLVDGFEYNERTNEKVLLHSDISKLADMNNTEIQLDNAIINATVDVLKNHNYKLRKKII